MDAIMRDQISCRASGDISRDVGEADPVSAWENGKNNSQLVEISSWKNCMHADISIKPPNCCDIAARKPA
jgi:hypothetical protein